MARITVQANRPGAAPVYNRDVEVTANAAGVDLTFPELTGTISPESAVRLGTAILVAGGGAAPAPSAEPASFSGYKLMGDAANGFDLVNASGAVVKSFAPVTSVTHYA